MPTEPYPKDGKWWIDKDPDDKRFYVANVGNDLRDSGTTAASVQALTQGVEVLEGPDLQENLIVVKLGGMGEEGTESFCTFRVTCANGEQFDRTIWFNLVDN